MDIPESQIFTQLVENLFTNTTNQNEITCNYNSIIVLTSWLNNQKLVKYSNSIIFADNFNQFQNSKKLWYALNYLEKNRFTKIQFQEFSNTTITACILSNDKISDSPINLQSVAIAVLDTTNLSCSYCGDFTAIHEACCHILGLFIAETCSLPIPIQSIKQQTHWISILRNSRRSSAHTASIGA